MDAHKRNVVFLGNACTTLGELARSVRGRKTDENVAKISGAGGVRAVVRAVEANLGGGNRADRMGFLVCACRALGLFLLDLEVRRSAETQGVLKSLCSVIRTYPAHDEVSGLAMPALQLALVLCQEHRACALGEMGGLGGVMAVLSKNVARKQSAAAALTLEHALRMLETLYTGEAAPGEGHVEVRFFMHIYQPKL
jgi:hypothetical protein